MSGTATGAHPLARLRIGFAGTPPFAAAALDAILAAGGHVELVLTQPDRPSGRGMAVVASAVKTLASERGLSLMQPPSLKTAEARAPLLAVPLDVLVVAAYGLLLPPAVLAWPTHGCLNIHASLLPRWRGAAPIQHAIVEGDATTGVTLMQMDAGLDTGPMLSTHPVTIAARETGGSLTARLAATGAAAIVGALDALAANGTLPSTPQPAQGVTHAGKVTRAHAVLDWRRTAVALDRVVRAFDPVPGAATQLGPEPVKVWSARVSDATTAQPPGTVVGLGPDGIDVACAEGVLRLVTVQPAGGKRMGAAAFAAGRALRPGACFAGVEG